MQRILLAIIILESAIPVDVYLFHQEADAEYGAVAGLVVSVATVCLTVLYLGWAFQIALRSDLPRPRLRVSPPAIGYLAAVAFSGVLAPDRRLALYDLFLLVQGFLLYVYISNRVDTRKEIVFLITMISAALLVSATIVVCVRIVGHDIAIWKFRATIEDGRVGGITGSPVVGGSYLALLLAPVASLLLIPAGDGRRRVLAVTAVGLGAAALLFTQTRGAWMAFGLSGLILLAGTWRRGWLPAWVPTTLAFGAVLIGPLSYPLVAGRLTSDDHGSAAARIPLIQMGLRVVGRNPVIGVGAGNCHHAVLGEASRAAFRTDWLYTVHNKYILVAVETGLVGLVFFLGFLVDTLRHGWIGWARGDRVLAPIALALSAAVLGHMVHMLVDVFNSRPQVQTLWCCAGIIAAISAMRREA